MRIKIDAHGLDRAKLFMEAMGRNAKDLYPLANQARERWHESEGRVYERRAWPARTAETERRYRYPIRTVNGVRKGRARGKGTGYFTGGLQRALRQPHQKGIKDRAHVGRGRLTLDVGIKGGREPRVYGQWFEKGSGARPPRTVVVFDDIAARDLAADTRRHLHPSRRTLR